MLLGFDAVPCLPGTTNNVCTLPVSVSAVCVCTLHVKPFFQDIYVVYPLAHQIFLPIGDSSTPRVASAFSLHPSTSLARTAVIVSALLIIRPLEGRQLSLSPRSQTCKKRFTTRYYDTKTPYASTMPYTKIRYENTTSTHWHNESFYPYRDAHSE